MSETNAHHFYKAWRSISHRANEAHKEYLVARDVASMVSRPKIPDFPGSKDVMKAEVQMQTYNALQNRVRFYKARWNRLDTAAQAAFSSWVETREGDSDKHSSG